MTTPTIQLDAVRAGEPEALAALCTQYGAAVLAFCDQVAAPRQGGRAAAEAFAQFRRDLCHAAEAVDVRAVLFTVTRRAAAARGFHAARFPQDAAPGCDGLETTLVARIEQAAARNDRSPLDAHIGSCGACARTMRRFPAGEQAFDRPPRAPLPPRITKQIISALLAAAPVRVLDGNAEAVRALVLQQLSAVDAPAAVPPKAAASVRTSPAAPATVEREPDPETTEPPVAPAQIMPEASATAAPVEESHVTPRAFAPKSRVATAQRRARLTEALNATRQRVVGSLRGSAERRRDPRPAVKGRGRMERIRGTRVTPGTDWGAELVAIGLFIAVAGAVALVTFLAAS